MYELQNRILFVEIFLIKVIRVIAKVELKNVRTLGKRWLGTFIVENNMQRIKIYNIVYYDELKIKV